MSKEQNFKRTHQAPLSSHQRHKAIGVQSSVFGRNRVDQRNLFVRRLWPTGVRIRGGSGGRVVLRKTRWVLKNQFVCQR